MIRLESNIFRCSRRPIDHWRRMLQTDECLAQAGHLGKSRQVHLLEMGDGPQPGLIPSVHRNNVPRRVEMVTGAGGRSHGGERGCTQILKIYGSTTDGPYAPVRQRARWRAQYGLHPLTAAARHDFLL